VKNSSKASQLQADLVESFGKALAALVVGLMQQTAEKAADEAIPTADFPKRFGVSKRIADAAARSGELSAWRGTRGFVARASHVEEWLAKRSVRKAVPAGVDAYESSVAKRRGQAA